MGTEADLLACETIPSLAEAKVLAGLIAEYGQPPAWISFSCRDGEHICDGTPIADVARAVTGINPSILATGVNCTAPGYVEDAVKSFANATSLPVIAYPNSGEGWNAAKRRWEGENDPRDFCEYARRWQDAGATLIGGCCRTGQLARWSLTPTRNVLQERSNHVSHCHSPPWGIGHAQRMLLH